MGEPGAGRVSTRRFLFPLLVVIPVVLWGLSELTCGALAMAHERTRRRRCYSILRAIAYACHLYAGDYEARDNGGPFPRTLGILYPDYMPDSSTFLCPGAGKATALADDPHFSYDNCTSAMFGDTHTDYVYVSGLMADDPPHYALAFDDEWNHDGDGVNMLFIGSNVDWLSIKELHEWLAWQEKHLAAQGRKMKLLRPAWSSWPDPPPGGRPWYSTVGGRALAVGVFVAVAAALALIVGTVRRGRKRKDLGAPGP